MWNTTGPEGPYPRPGGTSRGPEGVLHLSRWIHAAAYLTGHIHPQADCKDVTPLKECTQLHLPQV